MNKFEQVYIDHHKVLLAERGPRSDVVGMGPGGHMSDV